MNPWFKLYTEAVDDEKLRLLAFEDRWHFIALLCCKGKGILNEPNPDLKRRKVAVKLGIDPRTLDEVARRLAEVGLIDAETLEPLAWDDRQGLSDTDHTNANTNAERQRRFRERQRENKRNGDRNGDRNGSNVTVTPIELERELEREKEGEKEKRVTAHAPDTHEDRPSLPVAEATPVEAAAVEASGQGQEDFEAFWATYPKRAGGNPRTTALKAWNARCKDGHKASVIIDGARRYAAYCQATGKLNSEYVKQASTFLNQLSFLDPWNLPAQKAVLPRNNPIQQATTPETTEFDAIMRSLNRPMIEGKCHAAH